MLPFTIRRDLLRSVTRKSVRPRTPSFCQQSISSIAQGSSIISEQSRSKPTLFSFQNNHEAKFRFQSFRELNASVILNHEEDVMEIPPMNHSFDKPSRYLLSLLDDILAGRSSGMENITTERCNAVRIHTLTCFQCMVKEIYSSVCMLFCYDGLRLLRF